LATVITNLLSAIPWIGNDFVEFKNLIFNLNYVLVIFCFIYYIYKYILISSSLNTIGSVNLKGSLCARGQQIRSEADKAYALNIPYSFLSMLIGLIDGFTFNLFRLYNKSTKYFYSTYYSNTNNNVNKNNTSSCTSLVVWGNNMGSGVSYGRISTIIQSMFLFTNFQLSVLVGLLLSDGWLNISSPKSKNARLGFTQSFDKFEYFWLIFNIFAPFISNFFYLRVRSRNKINKYQSAMEFYTRSLPCFTNLYSIFYLNQIKHVPLDIFNLFNPIVLAHWIMGDGQYVKSGGLLLCTDSFTLKEVVLLINVLIIKYDFKCSLHQPNPGKYRIFISKTSMPKLQELVLPYMVKSMLYKIHK
jgi:hypothetical protein